MKLYIGNNKWPEMKNNFTSTFYTLAASTHSLNSAYFFSTEAYSNPFHFSSTSLTRFYFKDAAYFFPPSDDVECACFLHYIYTTPGIFFVSFGVVTCTMFGERTFDKM